MPTVSKQSANSPTKQKTPSALERVQSVDDMPEMGLKFLVYGAGKRGKTRFASTFPKPLLILGTENGTLSIKKIPGIDFIKIESSSDFVELTKYVAGQGGSKWKGDELTPVDMGEGAPYKSVCVDHASGFQSIVLKEVLRLDSLPVQMSWGVAEQSDWLAMAAQFKKYMIDLLNLSETLGTHVITIAHEKDFKEDRKDATMLIPTVAADLSPTVARWLNGVNDFVCNSFVKDGEIVKKYKDDKGVITEKKVKTGKPDYCLRVGSHPHYYTGFRHVEGIDLPPFIVNPTYEKMLQIIKGEWES